MAAINGARSALRVVLLVHRDFVPRVDAPELRWRRSTGRGRPCTWFCGAASVLRTWVTGAKCSNPIAEHRRTALVSLAGDVPACCNLPRRPTLLGSERACQRGKLRPSATLPRRPAFPGPRSWTSAGQSRFCNVVPRGKVGPARGSPSTVTLPRQRTFLGPIMDVSRAKSVLHVVVLVNREFAPPAEVSGPRTWTSAGQSRFGPWPRSWTSAGQSRFCNVVPRGKVGPAQLAPGPTVTLPRWSTLLRPDRAGWRGKDGVSQREADDHEARGPSQNHDLALAWLECQY